MSLLGSGIMMQKPSAVLKYSVYTQFISFPEDCDGMGNIQSIDQMFIRISVYSDVSCSVPYTSHATLNFTIPTTNDCFGPGTATISITNGNYQNSTYIDLYNGCTGCSGGFGTVVPPEGFIQC